MNANQKFSMEILKWFHEQNNDSKAQLIYVLTRMFESPEYATGMLNAIEEVKNESLN